MKSFQTNVRIKEPIKLIFVLLGILISIFGHLIKTAENRPLISHIFAKSYCKAMTTLEIMQQENFILKRGDDGFSEMQNILQPGVKLDYPNSQTDKPDFTQIKTIRWGRGIVKNELVDIYTFDITFSVQDKQTTSTFYYANLKSYIKERYLSNTLRFYGVIFFGLEC